MNVACISGNARDLVACSVHHNQTLAWIIWDVFSRITLDVCIVIRSGQYPLTCFSMSLFYKDLYAHICNVLIVNIAVPCLDLVFVIYRW